MRAAGGFRTGLVITITVLLAYCLTMVSLPTWAIWIRPAWVTLTVIYWALEVPDFFSLGKAWLVGLVYDLLQGTLLGEHALVLLLISYIVIKFRSRIQLFSSLPRIMFIFVLVLAQQTLLSLLQKYVLQQQIIWTWQLWLPAVSSAILWPLVYAVLNFCQRYVGIASTSYSKFGFLRD
jgi:rod shape-determining protein MreD